MTITASAAARLLRPRTAVLLLALGTALPSFGVGPVETVNNTNHWVWITIYDVTKTIHMDYGWVAPCRVRRWTGYGGAIRGFIRGEVKQSTDPNSNANTGPNIFDTIEKYDDDYEQTTILLRRVFETGKPILDANGHEQYYWDHHLQFAYNCRPGAKPNENCCTGKMDATSLKPALKRGATAPQPVKPGVIGAPK
jgi:hypothetical protein